MRDAMIGASEGASDLDSGHCVNPDALQCCDELLEAYAAPASATDVCSA